MFAPFQPGVVGDTNFMGPADANRMVLLIGWDADVRLGDEITNDATAEVFVVMQHPVPFDNPTDWSHDHQQIELVHRPIN